MRCLHKRKRNKALNERFQRRKKASLLKKLLEKEKEEEIINSKISHVRNRAILDGLSMSKSNSCKKNQIIK
jgi:hypothetical protein